MSPRPFLVASRTCLPRVPIGSSGGCRLPSDPSPACERPWPQLRAHAVTSFPFRAGPDAPATREAAAQPAHTSPMSPTLEPQAPQVLALPEVAPAPQPASELCVLSPSGL